MTDVIAGQTLALLGQFYDFAGGTLVDLDTTPTITITSVATGATALAATTSGVTHPGTGSYGYAWTPASSLTPGLYLVTWSGLKTGSPVTATETITVYAPASADNTNTSPDGIWYATRETLMRAVDSKLTARNSAQIDRQLEAASRDVEKLCHRKFFPVQATRFFDWPPRAGATPWVLRLDDQELASVDTLSTGGRTITPDEYNLEPVNSGPPFNRVEIRLSSDGSFGGGSTYQRDIQIAGLWAGAPVTEAPAGALGEALDATETAIDVDGPAAALLGVGSIIRVDSERMIVTRRTLLDTGQNLAADIDQQVKTVTIPVPDGSTYAVDEVILIDAERMLIVDIAGTNLLVKRAWDGTANAAHTAGADIYALRTLTVQRAALGTAPSTHASGTVLNQWRPPALVEQLVIGQAISTLGSETTGYTRALRAGEGAGERNRDTSALATLRQNVYDAHARKGRVRSV